MTLQSSPPISAGDINVELGRPRSAEFHLTGTEERALAGKPSGPISFSDFLGKSVPVPPSFFIRQGAVKSSSSNTLTGMSFDEADSTRVMVIPIAWACSDNVALSLSSATIGGVSATLRAARNQTGGSGGAFTCGTAVLTASVPTGTSGNVVCTFSGAGTLAELYGAPIAVYNMTSFDDTGSDGVTTGGGDGGVGTSVVGVSGGAFVGCVMKKGDGTLSPGNITFLSNTAYAQLDTGITSGTKSYSFSIGTSGTFPFNATCSALTLH